MRADELKMRKYMRPEEREVIDGTVVTWNAALKLKLDKDDQDDLRRAIHDIQRIVMSQVFAGERTFEDAPPFTSRPQR